MITLYVNLYIANILYMSCFTFTRNWNSEISDTHISISHAENNLGYEMGDGLWSTSSECKLVSYIARCKRLDSLAYP